MYFGMPVGDAGDNAQRQNNEVKMAKRQTTMARETNVHVAQTTAHDGGPWQTGK